MRRRVKGLRLRGGMLGLRCGTMDVRGGSAGDPRLRGDDRGELSEDVGDARPFTKALSRGLDADKRREVPAFAGMTRGSERQSFRKATVTPVLSRSLDVEKWREIPAFAGMT